MWFTKKIFLILAILYLTEPTKEDAYFTSFYDLSLPNSAIEAIDLVGNNINMFGGYPISNGVKIIKPNGWVDIQGNYLTFPYPEGATSFSLISSVKFSSFLGANFILWAIIPNSSVKPRCGLVNSGATGQLHWVFFCLDFNGDYEYGTSFYTPLNVTTIFGLSYTNAGGKVKMTVYVQYQASSIASYSFTSSTLSYEDFFREAVGAFRVAGVGNIYYTGAMNGMLSKEQFASLSSNANADTKKITCKNCINPEENLICGDGAKLKIVPYRTREYYCTCPEGSGYQYSTSKCVPLSNTNCSSYCYGSCKELDNKSCFLNCSNLYDIISRDGDFVECKYVDNLLSSEKNAKICDKSLAPTIKNFEDNSQLWLYLGILGVILITLSLITLFYCCYTGKIKCECHEQQTSIMGDESIINMNDIRLSKECKICFQSPPSITLVAIYPCGHASVCKDCIKQIILCPFDRKPIRGWREIKQIKDKALPINGH